MIRTGKSMSIGLCLYLNIGKEECAILSIKWMNYMAFYSMSELMSPKDRKNKCNPRKRSIIGV